MKLLNDHEVEYLLIGGYAVGLYGYPRPTGDLDVWVAVHPDTASKLVDVLREFGFAVPDLQPELFTTPGKIIRMGTPPVRIEIQTRISGVDFAECYHRRVSVNLDGIQVDVIHKDDLIANKKAAARLKDLNDLENLP